MNKDLIAIFEYLEREKGIKRDIVISAIEESLRAAAKKNISGSANVSVNIHPKTGNIQVYCEKEIVDEVEVPSQEITLEDAREIDPDCALGQFIDIEVTPKDFGRIAAQKARQIITQKLRGAERDVIYEEYRHRLNELISGTVKRLVKGANVIVDLGKVEAIMPTHNYPKTEQYQVGDRVLALLHEVRDTENGGAEVVLTRSHPEFIRQLLIQEVPEVADGTVIIEKIVRDPGYRTKMVVRSTDSKVDPVGACVGMRGVRIKNVIREINNEKLDVIPFANDPIELLQNALAPIEIRKVSLDEDNKVVCIVIEDDDYATVIGKRGMNARLNSEIIGYELEVERIGIHQRLKDLERSALAETDDPTLDDSIETLEGINSLILGQLAAEGIGTIRELLTASRERLTSIQGISADMADKIIEQIRKQRM